MTSSGNSSPRTLTIALGANIPSRAGSPTATLISARPNIEKITAEWIQYSLKIDTSIDSIGSSLNWKWSPLFKTNAIGGPKGQPVFINAAVSVDGYLLDKIPTSAIAATNLLKRFLNLEKDFGRDRSQQEVKWGPRTLDIDILSWKDFQVKTKELTLPHPHLTERVFVLIPLGTALQDEISKPEQLAPQLGWDE